MVENEGLLGTNKLTDQVCFVYQAFIFHFDGIGEKLCAEDQWQN